MHASKATINGVLDELVKIIQCLNDFNSTEEQNRQKAVPEFYSSLSEALFEIVSILKADLYNKQESNPITKDKMTNILKECELFVETTDSDKSELQKYFWDELRKQLNSKGYEIYDAEYDFRLDIDEYYARVRNRHRYYGFSFDVYKLQDNTPVKFEVEIENQYFYGFPKEEPKKENEAISKCIRKMTGGFKSNDWWFGWKYPSSYPLDFWNFNSAGFDTLKNPRKREKYIEGIAKEIDGHIKEFQKIAKELGV
jgi:site-specific DNA-cytosine methylase